MRTVFIPEKKLIEIKKSVIADAVNDNGVSNNGVCPENDEYVIGSEGGANDYFHVNESLMTESYNQFNLDEVGSLHYSVDNEYGYDEDTHKEWWNWYDSEEEYLRSCKNFDGEVYDTDGHQIGYFGGDADEIISMFGEDIGNEIVNGDGGWITDIDDRMANNGVDLNDVDSVNKAAKRLSKPNGESAYLLTDGDTIYFHDHAQIQSVDGMTISKFLELGNIRLGGGNVLSIELIKEPTVQQKLRLKRMLSYADEVYLDIAKPNKYDNMYPDVIFGVDYRDVNPDRIINDIFNYFEEGVRPLGEMKVDYKSVIEEAAKKVVPAQLLKWAIEDRPSPSKHLVIICSNGYLEYFEKKSAASNSLFHLRRWLGNNNVYFVDLDKVQLTENIESEVDASDINLSSFKKQDELAPKIWYGRKLNSKVRLKLLDIADDFWDFANINWVKRSGILLTGSICGKNWSKYSDIDLHIVVDFSKVDERTDFVQEYFNLKKNEWNNSHKNLKIYGFPVELYVEDINADTTSSNKYDLEKNDWVKENDEAISIGLNKYSIKSKSANIMTKIDDLQDECDSTDDEAKLRDIGKRAKKLYRKIKRMRKFGLNRSGEGDSLNIVYKVLRRSGHLEKLWDLSSTLYDKVNSLNEGKESIDYFSLAKNRFGTTYDIRECGYILPDGSMLDFTGSHSINKGGDSSHLKGRRGVDHREIYEIGWSEDGNEKLFEMNMSQFIRLGAIRVGVLKDYAFINLYVKPTKEQTNIMSRIIRYAGGCVDVEIGDGDESLSHGEYDDANPRRVIADIFRYFDEGIRLGINEAEKKHKQIIAESQESKSIAAAKKLVMQRLNYSEQEADEFIRIKLRNDLPVLRTPQGGKFILGVTRMFCDGELKSANDIGNLNSTLKLVASDAHINEYDRNLNNLSCQELVQRFAKAMSDNLEVQKNEIGQMVFDSPSDYEIVRIDSFEEAEEYGDYVSWCVTHDERMFDSYTNDGINQFYFCLKNGFENVEEVSSEGCPLDEYGLSMIAVSVNENGMLNTCTCRWNHDNGGDDSVMNTKEISQVIGMNFFEVFKPNNKWKDLLTSVMQRLANGEDPSTIFDYVNNFREGFAKVKLNNKWNFINQEGRLISNQWFDYADIFREGFAEVRLNNKWNFINKEGRLLSDQWFDDVGFFSDGFAMVRLNDKCNFINQEGKFLSGQWFQGAYDFDNGFAVVKLNDRWFRIDTNGNLTLRESAGAKEPINEYLDRNYNAPLYKYFKWAETASDEEKVKDLCYNSPYAIEDFIEKHQEIDEFEDALEKYDEDDWYDEDVIDWFVSVLSEYGLLDDFIDFFQQDVSYIEWPSWIVMSSPRIVKNEWCIHFGEDSDSIAREGFTHGTNDLEKLGYTRRDASKMNLPGYNFAYPAYYNRINTDYGSEAVLFQTSGVEIYHDGDCEHQVVFWGPYAKNFIPIKQAYGEWYVYGNKGQILYKSEDIDDIIHWAMNNKEQYRKQIMTGHG